MVDERKIVDALMVEYKEWLSRQRYWAKLVIQTVTILLAVSAFLVSLLSSKETTPLLPGKEATSLLAGFLVVLALAMLAPSTWVYFVFRKRSMKRLREIEVTLDEFGIHLGYQRTFDGSPIPKHRR